MNKIIPYFLTVAIAFSALLAVPLNAGDPLPVDPTRQLLVIVHDNVMPRQRDGWTWDRMENERFHTFKSAFLDAVKANAYDGPVKVVRFAANLPEADQVLNVYIYRWETGLETYGPMFTGEFAMEAILQVEEAEFGMGSFLARESHVALGTLNAEDFKPVARRAVDQMVEFYRNAIRAGS